MNCDRLQKKTAKHEIYTTNWNDNLAISSEIADEECGKCLKN